MKVGNKGDGHILNYITILTCKDTKDVITMFPSDEIIIKDKKKEEIER